MIGKILRLLGVAIGLIEAVTGYWLFSLQNSFQKAPKSPDSATEQLVPVHIKGAIHYLTQNQVSTFHSAWMI